MTNSVYDPENKSDQRYHPDNPDPLDNRPAGDPSDPRTIHKNPDGDEPKKNGAEPSENLRGAEESGDGFYNPEGDKRPASRQKLSATEYAGNLLADSASRGGGIAGAAATLGSRAKNFFWGTPGRKKKTAAGGIGAAMIGVGIFAMVSLSGAANLIQLSQILQRENSTIDNASSNRANKLLGGAGAQNIGETRVGLIERQRLRGVLNNLNEIGIEFKTNSTGGLTGTTIDTNKLAHKYPELEGLSTSERRSWLVDKYSGVFQPSQFVSEGNNKFTISVRDAPLRSVGLLRDKSLSFLVDHPIPGAINKRILGKFFDIPSLFHPIERTKSSALRSATHSLEDRINVVEEDQQKLDAPVESQADGAVDDVKSNANKYTSAVSNALLFTGGVCFVRIIADAIVTINRDRVVLPSAIQATSFIAVGEEAKNGQDVSADQINALNESLTNSQGQNVWQGRALQVTERSPHATGPDIPADYQQAFSKDTTANTIKSWADDVLGGSTVAGAVCSPVGIAAQVVASLALGAASIIGEIGSEGTLTPAIVGAWAAKEGIGFATSAIGLHFIQQFVISKSATGKLAKDAFSGPLGGNLLAYGAREAANIGARSEGGIALAGSVSQALADQQEKQSEQQFRSESFFARVFNIYDYRSLTGKLAQSVRPGYTQNAASFISGFGSMGSSVLSNLSSIFIPHSLAGSSYNWGFPKYGIPPAILNDPALASPNDNANKVAAYLDSGQGQSLIDKAEVCFGDKISKDSGVWDVEHTDDPNPNDGTYVDAHCDNLDDSHWRRIIMFVFDTSTAQAMACYMGDDDSCNSLGYNQGGGSANAGSVATVSGNAQQLAQQILDNNKISKTGRYVMEDLQNTAAGKPAYGNVNISLNILQFLADLGENTSYTITSITGAGSGHTSGSNHYSGHAVDLGCPLDEQAADESAKKYGLMAQNERCENTPGNEHMHYSKDGY